MKYLPRFIWLILSSSLVGLFGFPLKGDAQVPPANDYFTNRIELAGMTNSVDGDNTLATAEPGEPGIPYPESRKTLWWSYTAPTQGRLKTQAEGLTFGAAWGVFRGQELALLGLADSLWGPLWLTTDVASGEQVQIMVDGTFGGAGPLILQTHFFPTPTNDAFTNRITLQGTNITVDGSTVAATAESGEPGGSSAQTVWYSWQAPFTAKVSLNTGSSGCTLAVFTGTTVGQLQLIKAANTSISFLALAGATYQIQVAGANDFTLSLAAIPQSVPPNDVFANAYPMDGSSYYYSEWINFATLEPGEPQHLNGQPCKSLWWTWEAPINGKLILQAMPGSIAKAAVATNVTFAVYTGTALNALTLVGKGPDLISVDVICRTIYHIAVVVNPESNGEVDVFPAFTANSTAVVIPGNLVCDPSFETGQPDCWILNGNDMYFVNSNPMDGQFCLYLGAAAQLYQDVPTLPGHTYGFRFAYTATPEGAGMPVNVSWDGRILQQFQVPPDQAGTWTWAEYTLIASNNTSHVSFDNKGTNIPGAFTIDAVSVVRLDEPPSIVNSPVPASTVLGGTVAFSVQAKGTYPLSYQWCFNGEPIEAATAATFTLGNATTNNAGSYAVVVTNAFGSTTSAPVQLNLDQSANPTIVLQPYGGNIPVGSYYSLSVAAMGAQPLSFQWFLDGVPLQEATNRNFAFNSFQVTNAGTYSVAISNSYGAVLSLPAVLVANTTNQGGGVVEVANLFRDSGGTYSFPVFDVDGLTKLNSADSDYVAQLYVGQTIDSLRPVGTLRPFLTSLYAGIFDAEWVQLPTVQAGSKGFGQIRAWQRNYGLSYEEARALGGKFGRSPIFTVYAGGNVPGGMPLPAGLLYNLSSFNLNAGSPQFEVGRINFVGTQPDGSLTWSLTGNPGYLYLIEKSSSNMVFQPFMLLTNVTGTVNFNDSSSGQAMYRARILE